MTATAATPEVFTRKASGLVRVMSPYSAFVYNILTMGPIFPWVFLVSPTAFPRRNRLRMTEGFEIEPLPAAASRGCLANRECACHAAP